MIVMPVNSGAGAAAISPLTLVPDNLNKPSLIEHTNNLKSELNNESIISSGGRGPKKVKASISPSLLPGQRQELSKEEVEQLVPWRYLSKDYFLKRASPLSPSSLAPKLFALSTET
jgi:hypothetical protein